MKARHGKATEPHLSSLRRIAYAVCSVFLGVLTFSLILEGVLRFLPVNGGLYAMAVDAANPVFHFIPNLETTWSRDWNFSIVNKVKVNNAGFVNDQHYSESGSRPVFAVVGDSYVEAAMVPFEETVHGRLAARLGSEARVYSFAASGAPLSQYLVWAREARARWNAAALAIVVIANDFDESLATYKSSPGFHHYVSDGDGQLVLKRFDYKPNPLRQLVRFSALGRYLVFNLQILERFRILLASIPSMATPARADVFFGNTSAAAGESRLRESEAVVDEFLRDVVTFSGWAPDEVVFLVDGVRYPEKALQAKESYFARMRAYFLANARRSGFETIDLDESFFAKHRADGAVFEFQTDGHWNGVAHGLAEEALSNSALLSRFGQGVTRGTVY